MAVTTSVSELLVGQDTRLRAALGVLDHGARGFVMVVDADGKLVGVLTDGDIRRALLRGVTLEEPVSAVMRSDFVSLPVDRRAEEIRAALTGRIEFVPLVDVDGRPVDYASHGRHRRYPVAEPLLDGNEAAYLEECIRSRWISSQGRYIGRFEEQMAELHGMRCAVAVSNGTVALHLALVSLGIGPGDEVIVPDFTFAASANAVIHAGATPVLVDVDRETWTLDPQLVARAVTGRTRAIMPVHLYGHPCHMEALGDIAREKHLLIVEDSAEALGSRAFDKLTGTFGDASCYSFFGNKTVTTGEGGMILFRDQEVADRARMLRDHGMSRERRYWHLDVGYNYRLTNLQAAIGVAQMERAEEIFARKRALAARYDAGLSGIPGIDLPPRAAWADPTCWLYTITVGGVAGLSRDELIGRLLLNGIETRPVFYPVHEMPPYARYALGNDFPVTTELSRIGLSLPSAVTLKPADIDTVAASIKSIIGVRQMAVESGFVS